MPTFLELQDDAALLSFEHQLHLAETIGQHAWETDLAAPRFSFTGQHPVTCSRVHLLGSAAPGPKSWLWSWANPFSYREEVLELAQFVRDFGETGSKTLIRSVGRHSRASASRRIIVRLGTFTPRSKLLMNG